MKIQALIKWFYGMAIFVLIGVACFQCDFGGGSSDRQEDEEQGPQKQGGQFKNLHDTVDYVGMKTCRQCHEDVYQDFRKTGMGQSFGKATKAVSDANFEGHKPVYDSANDLYYYPYWQDSSLMLKEYRLAKGDTVHKRVEKIDHIIGSGHHTNSHMFSVNGYLYQAPITYYTQDEQWDLPPGFEDGQNSRFSRAIQNECMTCHNMYPESENLSANKYYKLPDGIECERCHGPGELHIKKKRTGKVSENRTDTDRTIVNPSKLPSELKNDVCQRCHLQGNAVLKEGKNFFDFQPGMELSSVMTVFRPKYKDDDAFIMASHSERLQESACFKESRKSQNVQDLNCITCHNPHKSVRTTEKAYFNKTCQSCHTDQKKNKGGLVACKELMKNRKPVNNNCVKCHMSKSGSVDIPHVAIHDHNISVPDSNEAKTKLNKSINELEVSHLESYNEDTPSPLTIAKAYLFYYEKFRNESKFLDSARYYLEKLGPIAGQASYIQYYYLRRADKKLTQFVESLDTLNFDNPRTDYRIGQAYANLGRLNKAESFYQKAVEAQPFHLDYRNKLAGILIEQREIQKAKEHLLFVHGENPKLAVTNNNLGFVYLTEQKLNKAENHIRKAIELNPDYPEAYLNLAKLHIGQNNKTKAKATLQKAWDQFPSIRDQVKEIQSMLP